VSLDLDKSTWRAVRFGDVVAASKATVDPLRGNVDRYIAGDHMDSDDLQIHRWGEVGDGYLGPAFHRKFVAGQILYGSRRTYLRKVAVAEFDGVTANTTFVVETSDPTRLLQDFLPWVMTSGPFHAYAIQESKGSVNPYINFSDLANFEFALPPLSDQRRLADLLWVAEYYRRAVEDSISATRGLLAHVREDWFGASSSSVPAGEFFDITMGRQRSPQHASGEHMVPYLRSANVTPAGIDVRDVKEMNFTPAEQEKFALRAGDVMVSEASASETAVGMPGTWMAELDGVVCFQNTLLRFRPLEGKSRPGYVEAWCNWACESGQFAKVSAGTSISHIGQRGASSMHVRAASLAEQDVFLSKSRELEAALTASLMEANALAAVRLATIRELFG
jgi:type I restriction enzyme S subunit